MACCRFYSWFIMLLLERDHGDLWILYMESHKHRSFACSLESGFNAVQDERQSVVKGLLVKMGVS